RPDDARRTAGPTPPRPRPGPGRPVLVARVGRSRAGVRPRRDPPARQTGSLASDARHDGPPRPGAVHPLAGEMARVVRPNAGARPGPAGVVRIRRRSSTAARMAEPAGGGRPSARTRRPEPGLPQIPRERVVTATLIRK